MPDAANPDNMPQVARGCHGGCPSAVRGRWPTRDSLSVLIGWRFAAHASLPPVGVSVPHASETLFNCRRRDRVRCQKRGRVLSSVFGRRGARAPHYRANNVPELCHLIFSESAVISPNFPPKSLGMTWETIQSQTHGGTGLPPGRFAPTTSWKSHSQPPAQPERQQFFRDLRLVTFVLCPSSCHPATHSPQSFGSCPGDPVLRDRTLGVSPHLHAH